MDDIFYTPPENPRHKRPHADMSQATLSPSPITFRGPATSAFASLSRYNPSAASNNDLFFERRRTSHPHNPPIRQFQAIVEDMSQRSQSQQRPRLEHRTSQTLIDLTEDVEDDLIAPPRVPSQRPPQLGRSDAQRLENVIDLTEDDAEIQITGARHRELPLPRPDVARPRPHVHLPRLESPGLFVPHDPPQPQRHMNRVYPDPAGFGIAVLGAGRLHVHDPLQNPGVFAHMMHHHHVQAMPGQMDYQHAAFAQRKPDHIAPEPAKPGFTRSPTERDIVICPSCEEELVHNKEFDEPIMKRGGKAPTRKEREEHPFWVIKECGHVYCNNCYQHRLTPVAKQPGNVSFPDKSPSGKGGKKPMCAVEDCQSDVKNKEKWVGVFL